MDPRTLKREFGRHIVFWGGGVHDVNKSVRDTIGVSAHVLTIQGCQGELVV